KVRAGSALLYPGPLWRGGWVKESPQDGPHGCGPVFRRYRDVPSENPGTRPRTRRAGGPEGAPSGWPSLWVTFLLATQEKSNSGAGRRSKTLCRLRQGGQGHPTPALPCMQGRELPVAASRAPAPHPTLSSLLHAERAQGCARLWGARKAAAIHGRSPRAPKGRGLQAALTSAKRSVRSSFRVVTGLSSTCRRQKHGSECNFPRHDWAASECAPGARCSTRGPYGAAGGWRKVRRMARMDASQFFAGTWTCRRKTPEPARAPGRQDAWRARHRGVVSSWLLLLWT